MGVFTVGRQVALEIDMPGWWLANAAVDMDFRRGLYYDSSTANPRAATDFLSCVRASVGYAKNSDGTLTSFASNALRIGSGTGLLIEDARTNDILYSEDYTHAGGWSGVNASFVGGFNAPNGTSTAWKIVPDTAGPGQHGFQQPVSISAVNYTVSIFAKAAEYNFANLELAVNGGTGGRYSINVNLSTGAIVDSSTTGSPTVVAQGTEVLGSWVRIWITITATAGPLYAQISPCPTATPAYSSSIPSYTGDGASGVYFWGVQFEVGSFPSSYIPTTGAAATRAAENITTSGSLQTAINAATGSLVAQTDNGGGAGFAANIVDSNGTNLLGFDASNHALASMIGTLATGNTANRTTQDKLGLAWNPSGRSLVLNGGTVANDASAQTPSATQHIGSTGTTNFVYAYVERLSAFTTKLADATLQGFTV